VHARDDADEFGAGDEVDAIREASEQSPATLHLDYRETLRHALDLGERDVDGAEEVCTKTGSARLIPESGCDDICLGGRADDEAHAHPA
jgi:hypothetical protein